MVMVVEGLPWSYQTHDPVKATEQTSQAKQRELLLPRLIALGHYAM